MARAGAFCTFIVTLAMGKGEVVACPASAGKRDGEIETKAETERGYYDTPQ